MRQHESGVNFQNLIRDLADMYPQEVDEVVVVELVANSLDAGATRIAIDYNPASNVLVIADNGRGMDAGQFDQYHDFAAGLKTRGSGIGFAGVGAKISFNAADRVITETVGPGFSGGSNWHFAANGRLLWEEMPVANLNGPGTRVEVHFRKDATPSYADRDSLLRLLQRSYLPLLDAKFLDLYQRLNLYSRDLRFVINGQEHQPTDVAADFIREARRELLPKISGKAAGFGVLGLAEAEYPLGADIGGVLLCTHGKVIKADLFNQFPGSYGPRIFGLVEMPDFIDFITTAKTDFNKGKGQSFERLYGPLRQDFRNWLAALGVQPAETENTGETARLERELRQIAEAIPELSEFFGFRNRAKVLQPKEDGEIKADQHDGAEITYPDGEGDGGRHNPGPLGPGDDPGTALVANPESGTERAAPITRQARRGPRIAFESRPDREELAWVDGNTVTINTGHPAYKKAGASATARHTHNIFAIAGAIQKFLTGPDNPVDTMFVDRMLAAWGGK